MFILLQKLDSNSNSKLQTSYSKTSQKKNCPNLVLRFDDLENIEVMAARGLQKCFRKNRPTKPKPVGWDVYTWDLLDVVKKNPPQKKVGFFVG